MSHPTVISSIDLRAFSLTPATFRALPLAQQQTIASRIVAARGDSRTAYLLESRNPNYSEFVVESDNAANT